MHTDFAQQHNRARVTRGSAQAHSTEALLSVVLSFPTFPARESVVRLPATIVTPAFHSRLICASLGARARTSYPGNGVARFWLHRTDRPAIVRSRYGAPLGHADAGTRGFVARDTPVRARTSPQPNLGHTDDRSSARGSEALPPRVFPTVTSRAVFAPPHTDTSAIRQQTSSTSGTAGTAEATLPHPPAREDSNQSSPRPATS